MNGGNKNLHEVVVTAIIVKDGKYLITRRAPSKKRFPGMWTVPGGKLETSDYMDMKKDTEHYWYNVLEKTLRREVKEEVGIEIKNIDYLTSLATVHEDLPAPRPDTYFVYVILCDNKSMYIGQTQNLQQRWVEHKSGSGAEYTQRNKPIGLIHYEEYSSRDEAVQREKKLKTGFGRKWLKREWDAGRTRQAGGSPSLVISCIAEYDGGEVLLQKEESDEFAWVSSDEAAGYGLIDGIYDELVMADKKRAGVKEEWSRS
jgi:predicted GIY-YIG superfamily endonuclease